MYRVSLSLMVWYYKLLDLEQVSNEALVKRLSNLYFIVFQLVIFFTIKKRHIFEALVKRLLQYIIC